MSSNITRLALSDDVAALVDEIDPPQAYAVLMLAAEQQDSGEEMTLNEALMAIRAVAAQVEAIG